jgi:hypothetical protein
VQLKDKWRNLIKFQHLRRGEIESAPYKATVRAKQNAAAAAKGNAGAAKAAKNGGASAKTANVGKKRNAADQGGSTAKKKGKTNASKGTNSGDLMDTFQKGPKGKRSKISKGGRFGGGADDADAGNIIDRNTNFDYLTNGGEGIGRSISPALPPKKQAFKQQKKKMKLLAEARKKAGTPDAKERALHAPSNAPPRKRVAAAWAAGISDVNRIGSGGLLNSHINNLDEDEHDILGAHLGHVTFDLDGDEDAHHLATTSGRGQNNKKGGASSTSMARFTEEMEREIEQMKERRAQMVRDVEYSERELARLKSLVEEAEKVYSQARLKAHETLQQAQKEIAEKRRKQSMEILEEQKKAAGSDEEVLNDDKKDNNKSNNKSDDKKDTDDNDGKDGHKSKGATTRKSLEASKQKTPPPQDAKVDDDEPSNEDVSPKSVPNLNEAEDVEVDDAEWDKYLAFGGDNTDEEDDEDMSEMQRAAQIASDEKKRKNYATDSEMNKSPRSPRLRSQANSGGNSDKDDAAKTTTPTMAITTAIEQNRRQQQQQYQFIPSDPNGHYDTDDSDDDLSSDEEDEEELDEEQLVSKAAWEKAQTALARAGLPPMQEIENVLLQELKRLEQANTKLVHARLALEACDSELSELFARAEARKAGVYNDDDDDLREQTTNTGSLPSDLQNIHTDDEEEDDLQVVGKKRKNSHDRDDDDDDDEDDDDEDDDDEDDDEEEDDGEVEKIKNSTRSGGVKSSVERDNANAKKILKTKDGSGKKDQSDAGGKKGGKKDDDDEGEENEEEKNVGKQKATAGKNKNANNSKSKQQADQKDSKKKSGGSGQKNAGGSGSGRGGSGFRSVSEDRRFGIYDARRYRSVEENDRDAQMNGGKIDFALGGSNAAAPAATQNNADVSNNDESGEKNRNSGKGKGKGSGGGQQQKKQGGAANAGRGSGSANARASSYKESAMAFAATHWPQQLKKRRDNKARKKRVKVGKSLWE